MQNYFLDYINKLASIQSSVEEFKIKKLEKLILETSKKGGRVVLFGNGGSSATASHVAVDLTKNAGIQSITFNEYDLITCFSNDYGFENWVSKCISFHCNKKDLIIFLSCSGNSMNLVKGCRNAKKLKIKTVCLTGFNKKNKLNSIKNNLNIWVNSESYNQVEIAHFVVLLFIVDKIIKKKN
jgi:D-sedoheptulose 7-phosphate isomerase